MTLVFNPKPFPSTNTRYYPMLRHCWRTGKVFKDGGWLSWSRTFIVACFSCKYQNRNSRDLSVTLPSHKNLSRIHWMRLKVKCLRWNVTGETELENEVHISHTLSPWRQDNYRSVFNNWKHGLDVSSLTHWWDKSSGSNRETYFISSVRRRRLHINS